MGPRSSDRGNPDLRKQGGVGLLALQWGRDHLIAEISAQYALSGLRVAASMGPRSSDRGNCPLASLWYSRHSRLQWGRDHLIAEIRCRNNSFGAAIPRFNGAAII